MRLSERTAVTLSTCAGIIAALFLISVLNGCGKKAPEAPAALLSGDGIVTGIYEIPVEQVKDKEITPAPGKNDEDVIAVVVVPPSEKPTTVQVYANPKKITRKAKEVITGDAGSPDYSVVSDNKGVIAKTERNVGLWPYIAGLFTLVAGIIAARKWLKRFAWVTKALSVVRRIIGL